MLAMVRGAIVTKVARMLAFAVLVGALSVGLGLRADACSCVQQTGAEQAARAEVVFRGTVTVIEAPITGVIGSADPMSIRFAVDAVYKGDPTRTYWVSTERSGASCGFDFLVGRAYTVFASVREDRVHTDICSGTMQGGRDPAAIGLPAGRAPREDPPSTALIVVILITFATAAAAAIGAAYRGRKTSVPSR
jgi:hypothetical protein